MLARPCLCVEEVVGGGFASICLFVLFFGVFFPPAVLHPYNKLRQYKLQFISWLLWVTPALHRYSLQK